MSVTKIKKEKEDPPPAVTGKRGRGETAPAKEEKKPEKKSTSSKAPPAKASSSTSSSSSKKDGPSTSKKAASETKTIFKKDKDEDELKGLEELYYAVKDGLDDNYESFPYQAENSAGNNAENEAPNKIVVTSVECPICDISETFDSNEKLQTHLVSHISPDGKDHQFQCLFCLEKHSSESVLSKHNQFQHPTETKAATSASYHCLICQQRFNSLHYLTTHLYKHNVLELPYMCQACGYRSSSHRDVVRHFYDDHKNQNFLQCPFCLDVSFL